MPGVQLLPSARPHPFAGQNAQAFVKIFQTLGNYETLRQKRMMDTDILGVLQRGGGIEEIAGVVQAHQQPQFDTGARGLFQRIASPFAKQPGAGITDLMTKEAIESAFKTISGSQMMAAERWRKYEEAVASGDKETADRLLSSALVNVKIGGQPWRAGFLGQDAMGTEAEAEHKTKIVLSTADRNVARQSVKSLVKDTPDKFAPGWSDYSRKTLIDIYEQYQVENDYTNKSSGNRKILDKIFDSQIATYNKVGQANVWGKGEFDWDPKDKRVVELRKATPPRLTTGKKEPAKAGESEIDWMGSIIVNPQTGERRRWDGYKWVTIK